MKYSIRAMLTGLVVVLSGTSNTQAHITSQSGYDEHHFQRHFRSLDDRAEYRENLVTQNAPVSTDTSSAFSSATDLTASYSASQLTFEPNLGQTHETVDFIARGSGYTLFLTENEAVFKLAAVDAEHKNSAENVLRMQLKGNALNSQPSVSGSERISGLSHYYYGNKKDGWQTGVPRYSKVEYEEVYPGIDLVYYGNPQQLEYDFVVAPGADPDQIELAFAGADRINIAENGDLKITMNQQELAFKAPVIYQVIDGQRQTIAGSYSIQTNRLQVDAGAESKPRVGFELAAYDQALPLVIDPILEYSTYLGGSGDDPLQNADHALDIAVDTSGQLFVTGNTTSLDFPLVNATYTTNSGSRDIFVAGLDSAGQMLFSTYIGGSNAEEASAIVVDSNGVISLIGTTFSPDIPTVNAIDPVMSGGRDAYMAQLNTSGVITYASFLGGSRGDYGYGIAVGDDNHLYLTGSTGSNDFPLLNAYDVTTTDGDAYVMRLDENLQIVYSTFHGGNGNDVGFDIAVDANDNVYLTGITQSSDLTAVFGAYAGLKDIFVSRLDNTGQPVYTSYLGGSGTDQGLDIVVDSNDFAVVTGVTESTDFTLVNAADTTQQGLKDAVVARLDPTGQPVFSTYLGGSDNEYGFGIAVEPNGEAIVVGKSRSSDLPLVNEEDGVLSGAYDAMFARYSTTGQVLYTDYFGASNHEYAFKIKPGSDGSYYIAGTTNSTDFPVLNEAYGSFSGGVRDLFITKLRFDDNEVPTAVAQQVSVDEDSNLAVTLTGTDPEVAALTYTITTAPQFGSLSGTAPVLSYTPAADYYGADSFSFSVSDGSLSSPPATVDITVNNINDAPVAEAQTVTTTQDQPVAITLSGTDPDGDPLVYSLDVTNLNGSLTGTSPLLSFTPDTAFIGATSFDFSVSDGSETSLPATVTINVGESNEAPVADDQSVATDEDTPLGITLTGSDADEDPLTYSVIDGPVNGSLTGSGASLTYTPNQDYSGSDSFTFVVNDGTVDSTVATVDITVNPVNDPPVAAFTISPAVGVAPLDVNFDASTSSDSDDSIVSYDWDFGDTNNGSGATVSHIYTAAGVYDVTLTVTDAAGDSGNLTQSLTVTSTPLVLQALIDSPISDEVLGTPAIISGTATSPVGVDEMRVGIRDQVSGLWWNNGSWGTWVLNPVPVTPDDGLSVDWSVSFNPVGSGGSGLYRVYARAREIGGALSSSAQVSFEVVENLTLDSKINYPASGATVTLPTTLSGSATAADGVQDVLITIEDNVTGLSWNGTDWGVLTELQATLDNSGGNSVSWSYDFNPPVGSGDYTLKTRAVDTNAVTEDPATEHSFTVNTVNYILEAVIDSPTPNETLGIPAVISGTATSPIGVDNMLVGIRDQVSRLWWNGSGWGTWVMNPVQANPDHGLAIDWNYSFNPAGTGGSGLYRAYVRARDLNGTLSGSTQVSFEAPELP